ncbi:MAG: hypothetical protein ACK5T0_06910 [Vampirovibrionales bacterium]|jgi:hypothetical protein
MTDFSNYNNRVYSNPESARIHQEMDFQDIATENNLGANSDNRFQTPEQENKNGWILPTVALTATTIFAISQRKKIGEAWKFMSRNGSKATPQADVKKSSSLSTEETSNLITGFFGICDLIKHIF